MNDLFREMNKLKADRHSGTGHWIGSDVIVVAHSITDAETYIRQTLDEVGLQVEDVNVVEILGLSDGDILIAENGDY